jgi:hypothetical protein
LQPSLHLNRATLVRDALVLVTPTHPACSSTPLHSLLATAFAPVMTGLIFLDLLNILRRPESDSKRPQQLCFRCWNLFFANPTVKSVGRNTKQSGDFNRRMSLLHEYSGTHT